MSITSLIPEIMWILQPQISEIWRVINGLKLQTSNLLRYEELCKQNAIRSIIEIQVNAYNIGMIEQKWFKEYTKFQILLKTLPHNFKNDFTPDFVYFCIKSIISQNSAIDAVKILSGFIPYKYGNWIRIIDEDNGHYSAQSNIESEARNYPDTESIILHELDVVEIWNYYIKNNLPLNCSSLNKWEPYTCSIHGFRLYMGWDTIRWMDFIETAQRNWNALASYYLWLIDFMEKRTKWRKILRNLIENPKTSIVWEKLEFEIKEKNGDSWLARLSSALENI